MLVRERLQKGDSDRQVLDYLVARYGDFILLKPPVQVDTLLLWGLPPAALVAGLIGLAVMARRRRRVDIMQQSLSEAEQRRLAALVERGQ